MALRASRLMTTAAAKAAMNAPPWREAASIILACRSSVSEVVGKNLAEMMSATKFIKKTESGSEFQPCDYKVLMVKRSQLSSFMANAYVFPGGLAEKSDFAADWFKVFEKCGVSEGQLRRDFVDSIGGPRPPMIENPITLTHNSNNAKLSDFLPADIGFRICAIREMFEETGVLLLTRRAPSPGTKSCAFEEDIDQNAWRQKLRSEPRALFDMCLENKVCPNIWALHEWADWLTPVSVGHRRYDTMFYATCLDQTPNVVLDQSEVVSLRWTRPLAILAEYSNGSVFLAPPQVYEMSRLANMSSYGQLSKFCQERNKLGIDRWLPVIGATSDGVVSLLPGDDLYPTEPDLLGVGPGPDFPFSLEEMRSRCSNLNRIDVQGPFACAHCNITPSRGMLSPISYAGTSHVNFQSMI
ncbi:nucleoside diphosphate-linked moiety X motif 19 [Galendromus occidentalis]|uniref:Nucleoside diphosphate-linked moiety X motif 19 n=1 Tax=Galendromus occidentalis TaxID=34638 RepID=A0AAJ6VUT5_9ACAR|nr:nucleoside diphosphate-linked moiety X motif 19 [Galendromus occidentalis]